MLFTTGISVPRFSVKYIPTAQIKHYGLELIVMNGFDATSGLMLV
ncbi:hypothetical protein [Chamaesiphon minutus]|uniref:Uncharacterized protein n=1 Tax=Chamaesiphon minutus (strain ATCC 27169 / PCC 6605) TaxID=1173020 RepID=K9UL83_CHAP6|nr:hypothetical protein [Chamaesiphon minutus]AFY95842.1 hypothetical protein Cha6605_4933 [Chamaesiphon minutus PCC 6605]